MHESAAPSRSLLRAFLVLASVAILTALVAAAGWYRSATRDIALEDLTREDRQRLVEDLFDVSGRAFTPAWFEPSVGYTLRRSQELTVWGDTFTSDSLGFRSGGVAKAPDTLRVLFVGDSWTYGMGVAREDAFPMQFEKLANSILGDSFATVESWPLALPGYNTMNEAAALRLFFDRLQPDLVVFCPTRNDTDSNFFVMPDGSNKTAGGTFVDRFGFDHSLQYLQYRFLDSFRYRERWAKAFGQMREVEQWLGERDVPLLFLFVAYWDEAFVHQGVVEAGITSPYVVGPKELAGMDWQGPKPWYHGTPEAYRLYGRMVYRGVASLLDWPVLATDPEVDLFETRLFEAPPVGDWEREANVELSLWAHRVPEGWRPGASLGQCPGAIDCESGLMGRATTLLVRRAENASTVTVTLERLPGFTGLYPLDVEVSIPSDRGGSRASLRLAADGPPVVPLTLELPSEVPGGRVLDVEIRASHATLSPDSFVLRSVRVVEVSQQ